MNLYRAIIRSYDAVNRTATIEPADGMATAIEDIPIIYASATADMITGALVLVADLGDGHHVIIGRIS